MKKRKRDIGIVGALVVCTVALLLNHLFKLEGKKEGDKEVVG